MNALTTLTVDQQLKIMEKVASDALVHWDMSGAVLSLVKHRENAVFKVSASGKLFALRVHRQGYHSDRALHSELIWMEALRQSGVDTPIVIPCTDGTLFKHVSHETISEPFQVDMQEWFDGVPLGDMAAKDDIDNIVLHYKKIGVIAAKTHNQAEQWHAPDHFVRHAWDLDGLTGEEPFWGRFWEISGITEQQKQMLLQCRAKLRRELTEFGTSPDRFSMIHADFLPENILVNDSDVRLIDFDDAGYGWHLFDLSTSLVFLEGTPSFDAALHALIEGYRQERTLSDEHLAWLPTFMMARWTTYIGWAHTRAETATAQEMTPYLLSTIDEITRNYLTQS